MASFVDAYELAGHRLPPAWLHLKHTVREAAGEFAGGVAVADIDKRLVDHALPDYSERWRAAADDYLGYAFASLQPWGMSHHRAAGCWASMTGCGSELSDLERNLLRNGAYARLPSRGASRRRRS